MSKRGWLFSILLTAGIVAVTQPYLWSGGFGFSQDFEIARTIEKDGRGNVVKQTETTKTIASKTFWDWLNLLGVPLSLALLGAWLQTTQQKQAKESEKVQQKQVEANMKEEVLQSYFDRISVLLIDKNLLGMAEQGKKKSWIWRESHAIRKEGARFCNKCHQSPHSLDSTETRN